MDRLVRHGALNTSEIPDESRAVLCYSGVAVERDGEIHAPVGLFNAWYREARGPRPQVLTPGGRGLSIEDWKRGIVQTRVGETVGTAFFVDDRHLLTCEHNLYVDGERLEPRAEQVEVSFTTGEAAGQTRIASLVQVHPHGHDLALLRLEDVAPMGVRQLALLLQGELSDRASVSVWGYPLLVTSQTDQGVRVLATLLDPHTTLNRKPALELQAIQQDSPAWGLSGAPVWTERGVIGVVSHQLLRDRVPDWDGVERPSSLDGRFYAVPIQLVIDGFGMRVR